MTRSCLQSSVAYHVCNEHWSLFLPHTADLAQVGTIPGHRHLRRELDAGVAGSFPSSHHLQRDQGSSNCIQLHRRL